jgi:endonuclease/exonuclease/phosphatase family metal-dependent hydrolase
MTWNIAAGSGGLPGVAEVIRNARPDVVALQEVDVHWSERSAFADQAAELGDALGMQVRFGRIYGLAGAPSAPLREFGLAILSRHPIVEFRNHVLPRLSTQSSASEPELLPGFLEAVVQVDDTRMRVFNTHLDYRADARVRVVQVAGMLTVMNQADGPVVLMGDLNAPPTAAELQPLFGRLRDVWREPEGIPAGFTYPASKPIRRIDYILTSPHLRALEVQVPPVQASDHRPVVATVEITSGVVSN